MSQVICSPPTSLSTRGRVRHACHVLSPRGIILTQIHPRRFQRHPTQSTPLHFHRSRARLALPPKYFILRDQGLVNDSPTRI